MIERVAAEVFSGPRTRYYLVVAIASATASAAGLAFGAIWLGLVLLIDVARRALAARLSLLAARDSQAANLALSIAETATLAGAPALAWYSRADLGAALAVALLCVLAIHAALGARRGRLAAAIACAPYGALGLMFMLEGAAAGAFWLAAMCLACASYAFAAVLHHVHSTSNTRAQDAEWLRQLNMGFADAEACAWELDFVRERLIGGEKLAPFLRRPVTFRDIVEHSCFAAAADRQLAQAVFSPAHGATRQITLEHELLRGDGVAIRVSHQTFLRTAPDGAPMRLTCITRNDLPTNAAAPADHQVLMGVLAQAERALGGQLHTLQVLANELGAQRQAPDEAPRENQAQGVATRLSRAITLIDLRRNDIAASVGALVRARNSAESANLAKSQFLSNMSHELRTPLNAIIGYAEMLQEDPDDEGDKAAVKDFDRILAASRHLLGLIGEVLDLSKIEAGRMDVVAAPFDPAEVLDELIQTVRPLAEQNETEIILSGHTDGIVNTDATKFRQCVLNLLSNACKFTHDGKIDAVFERRLRNGVDHVFVTVADTGIGMSSDFVARLFQPFVQAEPSVPQRYGGTGLGLTITRRLAQLLGGDVWVESEPAVGTSFTLAIPADYGDVAAARGAAVDVDTVQGAEGAPLVVVIEDEADARELAARALTRAGFAVQGVGGGEAGLALARSKAPALVLLDIFLPDRSGWRVLQSLKQDPKTRDIPVIVLSINEDRAQALALGAAEHIVKPADRDMLAATVMRFARARASVDVAQITTPTQKRVN